ncbi:MAG: hypothetical protein H6836_05495 [Planctomycetes bacterium]|nr:hypothetical protein [Planctomycetota bacterium]
MTGSRAREEELRHAMQFATRAKLWVEGVRAWRTVAAVLGMLDPLRFLGEAGASTQHHAASSRRERASSRWSPEEAANLDGRCFDPDRTG